MDAHVKPGTAILLAKRDESGVSAYEWSIVVQWTRLTGCVGTAKAIARRMGYLPPESITTPPARERLADALVCVMAEAEGADPDVLRAAYRLGGWDAAFDVAVPGEALAAAIRFFWPSYAPIVFRRG